MTTFSVNFLSALKDSKSTKRNAAKKVILKAHRTLDQKITSLSRDIEYLKANDIIDSEDRVEAANEALAKALCQLEGHNIDLVASCAMALKKAKGASIQTQEKIAALEAEIVFAKELKALYPADVTGLDEVAFEDDKVNN